MVLDVAGLMGRLAGDVELALLAARAFLESREQSLAAIDAALAAQDKVGLARAVHSLRGACAAIGGSEAEWLAAQMEGDARAGTGEPMPLQAARLREAVARLAVALTEFRDDPEAAIHCS